MFFVSNKASAHASVISCVLSQCRACAGFARFVSLSSFHFFGRVHAHDPWLARAQVRRQSPTQFTKKNGTGKASAEKVLSHPNLGFLTSSCCCCCTDSSATLSLLLYVQKIGIILQVFSKRTFLVNSGYWRPKGRGKVNGWWDLFPEMFTVEWDLISDIKEERTQSLRTFLSFKQDFLLTHWIGFRSKQNWT